ncbi:hypothetical protein HS121_18025 [bacterium]|nr:hypothetical protein [bacterium]
MTASMGMREALLSLNRRKSLNFRTSNFVYQTNIEDGHVFLLPLLDFQQKWAQMAQSNRIDESFLMIMEVASKMPMAAFGAEYFWDADLRKETVVERYALQLTHQIDAASHLRDGFLWLDELTYKGATGNDDFNNVIHQMSASFDMAFELLPAENGRSPISAHHRKGVQTARSGRTATVQRRHTAV